MPIAIDHRPCTHSCKRECGRCAKKMKVDPSITAIATECLAVKCAGTWHMMPVEEIADIMQTMPMTTRGPRGESTADAINTNNTNNMNIDGLPKEAIGWIAPGGRRYIVVDQFGTPESPDNALFLVLRGAGRRVTRIDAIGAVEHVPPAIPTLRLVEPKPVERRRVVAQPAAAA